MYTLRVLLINDSLPPRSLSDDSKENPATSSPAGVTGDIRPNKDIFAGGIDLCRFSFVRCERVNISCICVRAPLD